MKYVIKWVLSGQYVIVKPDSYFSEVADLGIATRFNSMPDAIQAIVERTETTINTWNTWRSPHAITIIGIKEINTPRYEEVAL